jgi:hypothetical protein
MFVKKKPLFQKMPRSYTSLSLPSHTLAAIGIAIGTIGVLLSLGLGLGFGISNSERIAALTPVSTLLYNGTFSWVVDEDDAGVAQTGSAYRVYNVATPSLPPSTLLVLEPPANASLLLLLTPAKKRTTEAHSIRANAFTGAGVPVVTSTTLYLSAANLALFDTSSDCVVAGTCAFTPVATFTSTAVAFALTYTDSVSAAGELVIISDSFNFNLPTA